LGLVLSLLHFEVFSVVLFLARVNNDQVRVKVVPEEGHGEHTVNIPLFMAITVVTQATVGIVLSLVQQVSLLSGSLDGILSGIQKGEEESKTNTPGGHSFSTSHRSVSLPVNISDGMLDESEQVLPESSLVTSVRVFLGLPELLEFPIVLLAHGSVHHFNSLT